MCAIKAWPLLSGFLIVLKEKKEEEVVGEQAALGPMKPTVGQPSLPLHGSPAVSPLPQGHLVSHPPRAQGVKKAKGDVRSLLNHKVLGTQDCLYMVCPP